uniref:Proteasome subunit beta type-3 n=1 Tax=Chelydra serpentina TaxID=8475 RepID=A0A8C3RRK6_CHESE
MLSTAGYAEPRPGMAHQFGAHVQHPFSLYTFNRGTVLAIAGEDFSIVASDMRLSEGYAIHSQDSPKCSKLTDQTVIGCSGFHGDCLTLTKIIEMFHCLMDKALESRNSWLCSRLQLGNLTLPMSSCVLFVKGFANVKY